MKDNGVLIIGVAVETKKNRRDAAIFRAYTKSLATKNNYFNVDVQDLDGIIDLLVDKSCAIRPGK